MDRIVVHTNFTNTVKQVHTITLDDLLTPDGLERLRNVFYNPDAFRAPQTTEQVTQAAAADLGYCLQYAEAWDRTAFLAGNDDACPF